MNPGKQTTSVPFSASVVVYNEKQRLASCLDGLKPSDQIVVYDMGSIDGSIEIARKHATEVRRIPRVEVVEKVWSQISREAKNDWIILLDPDEVFPEAIFPELERIIQTMPEVGMISIPWKFYFLGKPLNSTAWGKERFKSRVFHRQRVEITGILFKGILVKPDYTEYRFPPDAGYVIHHYWIDSIPQLFSKHWRYIKNDGEARYNCGERFNLRTQLHKTFISLKKNLVDYHGAKDGWRGIFLSFFHAWFIFMCHLSLCCYQYLKTPTKNNEQPN